MEIAAAIQEIDRPSPFLLKYGSSFYVVAGKAPFVCVQDSTDALISLLAVYYVFDLQWCKEVEPVLLVIEGEVIGLITEQLKSCSAASIFRNFVLTL